MRKILVTAFEPFGGDDINPSYEVLKSLDDISDDACIVKCVLPVEWGKSQRILYKTIDEEKPDKIILLGLSAGSDSIKVERIGINVCGAIKDNRGLDANDCELCKERKIAEDGCDGYFSTFNYQRIYDSLNEEKINVRMSFSCGTYMCNYVLYSALYKLEKTKLNIPVGFIHLPLLIGQRDESFPCMSFETLRKAVLIAIKES